MSFSLCFAPFLTKAEQSEAAGLKGSMKYEGNKRYYVTPSGETLLDKRRVGPIYPNIFDVARKGNSQDYITTEDEDRGCNLEKLFMGTIYQKHGFNVRKYLNALATSEGSCSGLATAEEQSLCKQYHSLPACQGTTPVVFKALPLGAGQKYLTYQKKAPFNCSAEADVILKDTYVSKQTQEWSKIEGDLMDKKRSGSTGDLKAKAPVSQIRKTVLAKNPSATQRDIDFAINDWVYTESKKATFNVNESEVKTLVEARYSPSAAMKNVIEYRSQIGGACAGKEGRYNAKVYAEGVNIPAHEVLIYGDYIDPANKCICK
ncbi:MAG: hypothetical protein SFU25_10880 [Candidatus Caenarcaniphilales bacterium]|nr:hypothetical protein [Candidatus Caenarcaniphilales bacterium]